MSDKLSESSDERSDRQVIVKVALAVPLRKLFDYRLPASLPVPQSGCRINVQFGNRTMTGLIIDICDSSLLNNEKLKEVDLHNLVRVPKNGICMEVLSWVKPSNMPHLTPTSTSFIHICLNKIGFPCSVSQELKV